MKGSQSFIDSILQNRRISHVLFWGSFLTMFVILASLNSGTFKSHMVTYITMLPAQIAAAYLLNYYQVPELLLRKKYFLFGVSLFVSVYFFSALARWCIVYIAEPMIREDFSQESIFEILTDSAYLFSVYFPAVFIYALIMFVIKTIKKRFEERHFIEVLQKEKATSELKFLKSQIQPHFLFNTLNNLYSLTLTKSDLAPTVVLKLSELLDFVLYQSNQPSIPISKELELIEGFIELESLRFNDRLELEFKHSLDNENTPIAPLLLLPLVENAFKHGPSGSSSKIKIQIALTVADEKLNFKVYNSKSKLKRKVKDGYKKGIGLVNLQRQLELNYPDKYDLKINEKETDYLVDLFINLN